MFKWPTEAQLHAIIHASDNKSRKIKTTTTNRKRNQSYHQGYAVKPRRMMILIINKINTNADTNYLNADTDNLNPEKPKQQPKQQQQTANETKATTKDMRLNQEE